MVLDVSISALLALLTIGMAYLGVHVTLHPPNESPRARSWYKRGFFACGALAVLLVIVQGVRTNKAQRGSAAQIANLGKDVEGAKAEAQAAKMEASNARTEVENESARRQQAEKDLLIALQSTGKATRQGIAEDIRKAPLQVEVNGQPIRDEGKNRRIREALGAFIRQGLDLKARCSTDDPKSSLEQEAQKWFEAVQGYLNHNLDSSYTTQFISGNPMPFSPPPTVIASRSSLWTGINSRLLVLDKFVDQLK